MKKYASFSIKKYFIKMNKHTFHKSDRFLYEKQEKISFSIEIRDEQRKCFFEKQSAYSEREPQNDRNNFRIRID